ncbi:glycosyltransferase [Oceanibaculum pacificum]|uniref:glycosyltransferase n=1 Tax=Oceanibaculum pacificum TaxID=580166 RepID=UPI0009FD2CA2|nr:glycosyltransferase [Oceanibaculum pacificum]
MSRELPVLLFTLGAGVYLGVLAEAPSLPAGVTVAVNKKQPALRSLVRTIVDARGGNKRRGYLLFQTKGDAAVERLTVSAGAASLILLPTGPALPLAAAARVLRGSDLHNLIAFLLRDGGPGFGLLVRGSGCAALRDLLQAVATVRLPVGYHADLGQGKHYVEYSLEMPDERPLTAVSIGANGARLTKSRPIAVARERDGATRMGVFLNAAETAPAKDEIVVVQQGDQVSLIGSPILRGTSLRAFLRHCGDYTPAVRLQLRERLGALTPPGDAFGPSFAWVQRLEARPAQTSAVQRAPFGGGIDLAIPCGNDGVFVNGWLWDPADSLRRFELISPRGERAPVDTDALRVKADKVAKHFQVNGLPSLVREPGFACFVPLKKGAADCLQFRAELDFHGGVSTDLLSPVNQLSPRQARDVILRLVPRAALTPAVLENVFYPTLAPLQQACLAGKRVERVESYGVQPAKPAVSVVVPLYGRYEFIRAQMLAFAFDTAMAAAELIYVLDKPEDAPKVEPLIKGLHLTFGVPCRLAINAENYGYAGASNLGAALGTAKKILFLNSDVVPTEPGWLARMTAFYDATPDIGLLGPKLLFPDGSLQHAGLYFRRDLMPWWVNAVYHKGYAADWPAAQVSRAVPGVTGACMMIARDKYEAVGGIAENYIVGDFEDSDLALRCHAQGWSSWYQADVALMHVERASIEGHEIYAKTPCDAVNGWQQTHRWGDAIAAVQDSFDRPAKPARAKRKARPKTVDLPRREVA